MFYIKEALGLFPSRIGIRLQAHIEAFQTDPKYPILVMSQAWILDSVAQDSTLCETVVIPVILKRLRRLMQIMQCALITSDSHLITSCNL